MGPRSSLSKAYAIPLSMQAHGLGMMPVSIKQLRATLRQKSIRTQKQSETKLDGVVNNKHEDFNLVFTNHGKEDGIYPPRTKIPSKEIAKAQNKDQ